MPGKRKTIGGALCSLISGRKNLRRKRSAFPEAGHGQRGVFPESALAHTYCQGTGLEIGGSAHNPFGLDTLNVDLTDSMNTVFKQEEKRLCGRALEVDIVAGGDDVPFPDASQDFIVSSHVIEHFPNPIKALIEWNRLVKPGGIIFMIVPHKKRTFDRVAECTSLEHLIQDFENDATEPHADSDPQLHDHRWVTETFVELIQYMIEHLEMRWEIVEVRDVDDKVGNGFTVVIRKLTDRDGERVSPASAPRVRKAGASFRVFMRSVRRLCSGGLGQKLRSTAAVYKAGGIRSCWRQAVEGFRREQQILAYRHSNELSAAQSRYLLEHCPRKPLFSIVVPVYRVKGTWLNRCIQSLADQHYANWELIVVDDASQREDLRELIDDWSSRDERIRAFYLERNEGIAGATNFGIKQARGEFIGFVDHDDELTPDALTWMTHMLNEQPEALWLYSDEDLMSTSGRCHSPHFKPDFSPEFLLSNMFTCHFSVYSAEILQQSGGLRSGLDGSQDHDLALRLSEIVPRETIVHIPRVLYHWRVIPGSTAKGITAKPAAPAAGRQAVRDALERRNLKGTVTSHEVCETMYQIEFAPRSSPRVSIIIPVMKSPKLVEKCIASARRHTEYQNYEIVVVRSGSGNAPLPDSSRGDGAAGTMRMLEHRRAGGYSAMNNVAVASADSPFVVFMHDDVEIVSDRWLEQLIAVAELDESIAVVAGLLLYRDGTVQHGGTILGCCGGAGTAHKNMYAGLPGYFGRLHALQEMSGVTAALALVRRSSFQRVGGFNADRYPGAYNDVDLCIRLRKNGFRCIYNPMVRGVHDEREGDFLGSGGYVYRNRLAGEHAAVLDDDPFYNRNLGLDGEPFQGYRPFPVEEQIPLLANMREGFQN